MKERRFWPVICESWFTYYINRTEYPSEFSQENLKPSAVLAAYQRCKCSRSPVVCMSCIECCVHRCLLWILRASPCRHEKGSLKRQKLVGTCITPFFWVIGLLRGPMIRALQHDVTHRSALPHIVHTVTGQVAWCTHQSRDREVRWTLSKPGKAPGPDKCPNELLKTISDEEFLIVQAWVKEILTLPEKTIIDTARQSRSTMNGTISQLHKGGSTNKTSDQRPVVLLNSGYQLLNYIINERLKRIVE